MIGFSELRVGEKYKLTVRKASPRLLHDSIGLNQSITVEVLSVESGVLEAKVLSRNIPKQIVLRSAVDNGIIEISKAGLGAGCVFLLILSAAFIAAALYWFRGSR